MKIGPPPAIQYDTGQHRLEEVSSMAAAVDLVGKKAADAAQEGIKLGPSVGNSGLKHWAGYISEEFLGELRGARGMRVYDEMRRNEPAVAGMLAAITAVITQMDWDVQPKDKKNPADVAAADLVRDSRDGMKHAWDDFIGEVCTMFAFGWSLFEIVYKLQDGRVMWDKLAFRGQDSLTSWTISDNGDIEEFVQLPAPDYKERKIPQWKFLLFRTNTEKNNPEGIALLRPAYKPYFYKRSMEEVEAIGAERDLIGVPIMEVPWGATAADVEKAQEIVENIKNDDQSGVVLTAIGPNPEQRYNLRLLSGQGSSGKVSYTDRLIQRYAGEIHMVTLSQFLRLGMTGSGSYALSSDQRDLFQIAIRGWMKKISAILNRDAIPRLLAMNGMTGKCSFVHGRIGQLNLQTFVNFVTSGVQNGFLTITKEDEQWLRKEAEMPPLPEGTEAASEKKAAPTAAEGGPDNSGLNANPGENQNGIFGSGAEGGGDNPAGEDDDALAPTGVAESQLMAASEPMVFNAPDGDASESWYEQWSERALLLLSGDDSEPSFFRTAAMAR